jgi:hypothetical protein
MARTTTDTQTTPDTLSTPRPEVFEAEPLGTQASRLMKGQKPYIFNEPLLADGQAREMHEPGYDTYSLSPAEKKKFVPEGFEHCWVRNPQVWHETGREPTDRIRDMARMVKGFRPVTDSDGCLITQGDLCLGIKPAKDPEIVERRSRAAIDEYIYNIQEGDFTDGEASTSRFRSDDTASLRERSRREHLRNVDNGLIGDTRYRDFDEMMRSPAGRAEIEREEERHRSNGRHVQPSPEQEKRIEEARARLREGEAGARGGFVHAPPKKIAMAVGATGIGKTTEDRIRERGHR